MAQSPSSHSSADLTDLQRRRLGSLFQAYDTNKDGYVGREDLERRFDAMARQLGLDAEGQRYQDMRAEYLQGWDRLQAGADSDNDQRVTRDEFLDFMANAVIGREGGFAQVMAPALKVMVAVVDTDRDGRIGLAEFVTWQGGIGVAETDADQTFRRLDRDGDSFVTQDELIQALQEYFTSTDPDAPGNSLYGGSR
jgi:Ca2+-binding EF-hand superfamily protein